MTFHFSGSFTSPVNGPGLPLVGAKKIYLPPSDRDSRQVKLIQRRAVSRSDFDKCCVDYGSKVFDHCGDELVLEGGGGVCAVK